MLAAGRHLGRLSSRLCVADSGLFSSSIKLVILPRTRAGLGREGLREYLETVHGPMVVNAPDVSGNFSTYVHHYTQDLAEAEGVTPLIDRDAVTIIRLRNLEDLRASKASAGYRNKVGPDEDNFRDTDGSVALLAEEQEVVAGADNAPRKLFIFRNAMQASVDEWASTLSGIVRDNRLLGAIINDAKVVEGQFPYLQFDEIGLPLRSDPERVAAIVARASREHFGSVDTGLIYAETVRFI